MMSNYKYNVDTTLNSGNCTITTSFGFDTVSKALERFNDSIELRRRSHVVGQYWDVTLYDMDLATILGSISSIDFNLE